MPRPRFSVEERDAVYSRQDNPHTKGHCWHCGCIIAQDKFHIDHHPVAFRDIERQLCIGITDPKDPSNLVPSCPRCNTSHAYEVKNCMGYTQCRLTCECVLFVLTMCSWTLTIACVTMLVIFHY